VIGLQVSPVVPEGQEDVVVAKVREREMLVV
jgi:hypothetical protein